MTLKHSLIAGAARAVFAQPLSAPLMLRGPMVPFSPDHPVAADPAPADPEPAEAPATDPAAEAPAGDETPAGEAPAPATGDEEPKKPKSPVAQLQGRVGHLTKTIHQKDADLAERDRQIDAYKALLAASGNAQAGADPEPKPASPATAAAPLPGTPEFDKLVSTEAQKVAARQAFDRDCNAILDTGATKFGPEFKTGVESLNALGIMSVPLVQAAMATGAAPEVIHALGSDTEEAERIASLPPVQMGVELAKLAGKLQARDPKQVSRAPAPITPVGGSVKPEIDLASAAKSGDMDAYVAARKAQGSRWAK